MGILVVGPALAAGAAVLGRALGAALGMVGAMVILAGLAAALGIGIGRWRRSAAPGAAAAALWLFVGAMNADAGTSLALLASGEHVTTARIADVAAWRDHPRVTFADGQLRTDLSELARHEVAVSGRGVQPRRVESCTATPIVPAGWTADAPVRLWALEDRPTSEPLARQTFAPIAAAAGDCERAIAAAMREHGLARAPDAVYLERLETLVDPDALRLRGTGTAIVLGAAWLLGAAWRRGRAAVRARRA